MSEHVEQESASPFIPGAAGAGSGQSDAPATDGADASAAGLGAVGADLPTGHSEQRRSMTGALLIVMVVVIAGGVLYMMRQFGLGSKLQLLDFDIEYPVDGATGPVVQDEAHRRIIDELRRTVVTVQIPLEDVKKNPFELARLDPDAGPSTPENALSEIERRQRQREAEISRKLADLKLDSIMGGKIPLARISGKLVRVGDTISDIFRVQTINGRSVELIADGEVYRLAMGE